LVKINLAFTLEEQEKGTFNDMFDPSNSRLLNIVAIQDSYEEPLRFIHLDTSTPILVTNISQSTMDLVPLSQTIMGFVGICWLNTDIAYSGQIGHPFRKYVGQ